MSLKERVYGVLLVSASENFNRSLLEMLPPANYDPIVTEYSVSAAKRAASERDYDLVIINSPLPDEDGVRFAIDESRNKNTVVLLIVRAERYAEVFDRAAAYGVFTMAKPLSRSTFSLSLDWLSSARERLRQTESKVLSVEEKMDEIRLVNRAKWLLISELKMTEPDAHRYIEKQAMDRCVSKRSIAEDIIRIYG